MPTAETDPFYNQPMSVSLKTLALMRRIDELHLHYPFARARMLRDLLRREGYGVGWRHVATLMRRMGLTTVYCTPRISQRHPAHSISPYLLRQLAVTRPNHLWAADITYTPDATPLRLSLCDPGLGESPDAGLAVVHHVDHGLLP